MTAPTREPATVTTDPVTTDPLTAACDALRRGRPVLVVSEHDQGVVVLAASTVTTAWTAWTVRMTSGLLCAPMTAERADALGLPTMVRDTHDPRRAAYTVSVDARDGISTGISAADRATTVRLLADPTATVASFVRPGHVLPLRAVRGGVLRRAGYTEAAVDLCALAGLPAVGLISQLVTDDGSLMPAAEVRELGSREELPVLDIAEIVGHLMARSLPTLSPVGNRVVRCTETNLPTRHGVFRAVVYQDAGTGAEHIALIKGPLANGAVVRVHAACLAGESFGSSRCGCGPRLDDALARVADEGGAVVYLRGRAGHGPGPLATCAADVGPGGRAGDREYGAAAAVLLDLGLTAVRLVGDDPDEVVGLEQAGVAVLQHIPAR